MAVADDRQRRGNDAGSRRVHLLKPATYMNNSGAAVRALLDYYKLAPTAPRAQVANEDHDVNGRKKKDDKDDNRHRDNALLVVVDDVALPFGTVRLRARGSDGGHNGLKSVERALKTREYARLRVGVGGASASDMARYVLDEFTSRERARLDDIVIDCMRVIDEWVRCDDMARVMNFCNGALRKRDDGPP